MVSNNFKRLNTVFGGYVYWVVDGYWDYWKYKVNQVNSMCGSQKFFGSLQG